MSTTVTPSFTGSISATLQGTDVKDYRTFGSSLLPLVGRSDRDLTYISSSVGVLKYDTSKGFFDDSLRFPVEKVGTISDDTSKIIKAPNYELEDTTYGITRNFRATSPYLEMGVLSATQYITERRPTYEYPIVLDHPNAIDPLDMNGVIEPLTIRSVAIRSSLFLGNEQDPEPHSTRGGISGPYGMSALGRAYVMSSFYEPGFESKLEAFKEYTGTDDGVLLYGKPVYTTNEHFSNSAFSDSNDNEARVATLEDSLMKSKIISNSLSGSNVTQTSFTARTTGCGFIYDNCQVGTDSIAFGGLLK